MGDGWGVCPLLMTTEWQAQTGEETWNVQECAGDDWTAEQVAKARGWPRLHQECWTIRFWGLSPNEMKGSSVVLYSRKTPQRRF